MSILFSASMIKKMRRPWQRGGVMVSALSSRLSGPGSSPGRGHTVVLLDKTLNSDGTSLSTKGCKWVPAA